MNDSDVNLRDWIGRERVQHDQITVAPLAGLSSTLDRDDPAPQLGDALPACWHWLFFLPRIRTDALAADGHAIQGGFMPPTGLPRRMWAGSRVTFAHAPRVGDEVQRVSRIADVTEKHGASGRLVFVTVHHEIHTPRGLAIEEAQDLVYREVPKANGGASPVSPDVPEAMFSRVIRPDPVLLFRYSALTFNSHRIHYDRPYVTNVEGYPGLLVHGPLIATLLLDLLRRETGDATVSSFTFKAQRPLFDTAAFSIHGRAESTTHFSLWALDADGQRAVQASATIA